MYPGALRVVLQNLGRVDERDDLIKIGNNFLSGPALPCTAFALTCAFQLFMAGSAMFHVR